MAWEERQSKLLRDEILVKVFGGCGCRMHNCKVNWEWGLIETPENPNKHREQARLARLFDYRQRQLPGCSIRQVLLTLIRRF
jgi:hypothetical protein